MGKTTDHQVRMYPSLLAPVPPERLAHVDHREDVKTPEDHRAEHADREHGLLRARSQEHAASLLRARAARAERAEREER